MEKTTRGVPEDVQKKADDLYWDRDGSHNGFGCAEEAYEYVAEWARNEALEEAAEVARSTPLTLNDIGYEAVVIADAIRALAEGGAS